MKQMVLLSKEWTVGLFVCLGFNVAFKHLSLYRDSAYPCSSGRPTLINVLLHRNAMPQTQDMAPQHPTSSQYADTGRPVVVLSIDVERHTGIHNCQF